MKHLPKIVLVPLALALVLAGRPDPAPAADRVLRLQDRANAAYRTVIQGGLFGAAVRTDSVTVFGGDLGNGDFQDAYGAASLDGWTPVDLTAGVGNFGHVLPFLYDMDPLHSNNTPQVTFVDDGTTEPTGGFPCITWCYGPDGYIVNSDGGLLTPDLGIHNEVWSPVFDRLGMAYFGASLAFDVYVHLPHGDDAPHICYTWRVRSTTSPDPQDLETAPWRSDGLLYHGPDPRYLRFETGLTPYLEPGWEHAQVALGVIEPDPLAGGVDGTPAPYFDNVVVKIHEIHGPAVATREAHLAQDAFPAHGTVDLVDLGQNSVPFDMASNIALAGQLQNVPGDSIVITATAARPGSFLYLPQLRYQLRPNPLFDPCRWAGMPDLGEILADSCYTEEGAALPDRFCFYLPDEGFLFPGDVLHYFIFVEDDLGGDVGLTMLPADTTDFGRFDDDSAYDAAFVVRALPSLISDLPGDQPRVLFVNDNPKGGNDNEWHTALRNLGFAQGLDYDTYWVNEPAAGVGNGIGGRATPLQLEAYDHVLYTCGDLAEHTLSNGDAFSDPGDDLGVLDAWLQQGGRNLLACGDNLVYDLAYHAGPMGAAFTAGWLSVTIDGDDVGLLIGNQVEPTVAPTPANPVFTHQTLVSWPLLGLHPVKHRFDAVIAVGDAEDLAGYLTPGGVPGAYPYSAATLAVDPGSASSVVSLPYDLASIGHSGVGDPLATRTRVLEDILLYFGAHGSLPPFGVPDPIMSYATTAATEPVVVLNSPDGLGHGLTHARTLTGELMDATIAVQLLDGAGIPVADFPAEDIWLETDQGGLVACSAGAIADADTDLLGRTTFAGPVAGGGYSNFGSELTWVVVNGQWLDQSGFEIEFQSFDLNGDLTVNLADITRYTQDYFGPYHRRSDFHLDGVLDLGDYILMIQGNQRRCGESQYPPIPLPAETDLPPATLGFYWDAEGTQQVKFAQPDDVFQAYLLLKPSEAATVAGVACQLTFDPVDWSFAAIHWSGSWLGNSSDGYEIAWPGGLAGGPDTPIELARVDLMLATADPVVLVPEVNPRYSSLVQGELGGRLSANVTALEALINPEVPGAVIVEVEPDLPPAQWHLTDGNQVDLTSWGDTTLVDMPTGEYTLTWLDVPGWFTPEPNPDVQTLDDGGTVTFFGTYVTPRTTFASITDVPNDHGRNLRLVWERSLFDAPDDGLDISGYGVYRRQDAYKGLALEPAGGDGNDELHRLAGWDFLAMVPAHGDSLYQYVAPTLCDSTDAGICWSVFFLRTMTPDPFAFWDSSPDSGYSIDNLVPVVPGGLAVAYAGNGNELGWDDNPDPDIRNYNVYRADYDACVFPGGEPIVQVATPGWFDDLDGALGDPWDYCYFVTAVDFAGNESEPTAWTGADITGLTDLRIPTRFALHPCSPNPFNPRTAIRFDLPRTGRVDLAIFDLSGRLVRRLITAESWVAGRHEITWQGLDDGGRRAASGVYFCRLRAGDQTLIQRMALVK